MISKYALVYEWFVKRIKNSCKIFVFTSSGPISIFLLCGWSSTLQSYYSKSAASAVKRILLKLLRLLPRKMFSFLIGCANLLCKCNKFFIDFLQLKIGVSVYLFCLEKRWIFEFFWHVWNRASLCMEFKLIFK